MALTVAQLVARLSADTSGFYKSMAIANSSLIRTGGIASRVFAGAGIAATAFGFLSLRMAGNYQQSMNILEAVSGATEGQMKKLGNQAIALGRDFKLPNVSAKDAADAMTALAKGGLSVHDVMGAVRGVLQLGIASDTAFADSAVIVARALKAFGLEGTKATHVADLFTAAANASTSEMGDIALGFQMASAQFKRGQQSIEDLTTAITIMNDAGVVGSDAGTSLKTMMNRLLSPTGKAAKLMKEYGLAVYDANGNVKPMPALVDMFSRKLKGLSNEQRNAALYTIFGSDAIRAANIVLLGGAKKWDTYSQKVNQSGAAQRMAEARTKGFNGAMQAFQSQVETLAIELGVKMLPAATQAVRGLTSFVAAMDADKIAGFVGAIVGAVSAIVRFVSHSQVLLPIVAGLVAGFLAYRTAMMVSAAATWAMAAAQAALDGAMAVNPIFLIIAALVGLGVALVVAYRKSETFRNIVQGALRAVQAAGRALITAFEFVKAHWQAIFLALGGPVAALVLLVVRNFNTIRSVVTGVMNTIVAIVKGGWNALEAVTSAVWHGISAVVTSVVGALRGAVASRVAAIRGAVSAAWNAVRAITNAIWSTIPAIVRQKLAAVASAVTSAAGAVYSAAVSLGHRILEGILAGVSGIGSAVASKIGSELKNAIPHIDIPGFSPPEQAFKKAVGIPIGRGIITGFLLGIRDLPNKVSQRLEAVLTIGRNKVSRLQDQFHKMFDRIRDTALAAFDAITQSHQTPTEALINQLEDSRNAKRLQSAVDKAQEQLNQAMAGGDPQEIADAQQALDDAKYEQWKVGAEKQAAAERQDYEARRALQRTHLQDDLDQLEAYLAIHPKKWQEAQEKITGLLAGYGLTYQNIGKALGDAYVEGMRESLGKLVRTLRMIATTIAKYLKIRSPAELGPMRDLDHWWDNFVPTLAKGLDTSALERVSAAVGAGAGMPGQGASLVGGRSGAAAGGSPVIYSPNFYGTVIQERDALEWIRQGIVDDTRRDATALTRN